MAASLMKIFPHKLWTTVYRPEIARLLLPKFFSDSSINGQGEENITASQNDSKLSPRVEPTEGALRKFDKLVEKVKSQQSQDDADGVQQRVEELNQSFATMLRKSKLVALGEDQGKRVTGKIIEVMEDDLYIDFGGKFHCVCQRPRKNGELYHRGTEVTVSLKSQEMSSSFLGSDIHITLLEADAILLGVRSKPKAKRL